LQQNVPSCVPGKRRTCFSAYGKRNCGMECKQRQSENGEVSAERWYGVLLLNQRYIQWTTGNVCSALSVLIRSFAAVMTTRPNISHPVVAIFVCGCSDKGDLSVCG